jgi:hypothetical protein
VTVNVAQPVVLAYETALIRPGWLAKAQRAGLDADSIEALFMTTFRKATQAGPLDYYRRVQQEEATLRQAHGWARAARRHATVALWTSGAAILLAVAALLTSGIFRWTTRRAPSPRDQPHPGGRPRPGTAAAAIARASPRLR